MQKEPDIHEMAERLLIGAFLRGGPNYREPRELMHLARRAVETDKEIDETLSNDDGCKK